MFVFSNVIKPQGLEPLQFPTKFRSHSQAAARAHWAPVIASCETYDFSGMTLTLSPDYSKTDPAGGLTPTTSEVTFEGENATVVVTGNITTKWTRIE